MQLTPTCTYHDKSAWAVLYAVYHGSDVCVCVCVDMFTEQKGMNTELVLVLLFYRSIKVDTFYNCRYPSFFMYTPITTLLTAVSFWVCML